jgi:hypothetical protein
MVVRKERAAQSGVRRILLSDFWTTVDVPLIDTARTFIDSLAMTDRKIA